MTGLEVGEVGMGGIGAMGKFGAISPEEFGRTMSRAEELGMNFLDTAPSYGDSESVFGHYLADHGDRWIVCTKVGGCGAGRMGVRPPSTAEIAEQLEGSLRRLRVDHADVVLLHSLDQYLSETNTAVENISAPDGPLDGMRKLQERGLARFIGVSGQVPHLVDAVGSDVCQVILTYNSYNLLVREAEAELLPLAQEHNVGVIMAGAFYQGLLCGREDLVLANIPSWFERQDPGFNQTERMMAKVQRLKEHTGRDARRLHSLALRFSLFHPAVSVLASGMSYASEVEQNAAAAEKGPLSEAELAAVEAALGDEAASWDYANVPPQRR